MKNPRYLFLHAMAKRFIFRYGRQTKPTMYSCLLRYINLFGIDECDLDEIEAGRYLALTHAGWDWQLTAIAQEPAFYKNTVIWARNEED